MGALADQMRGQQILVIDDDRAATDCLVELVHDIDLKLTQSEKASYQLLKAAKSGKYYPVVMINIALNSSFIQDIVSSLRMVRTYRWPHIILYSSQHQALSPDISEVSDYIVLSEDSAELMQAIEKGYEQYTQNMDKINQQFMSQKPRILLVEDDKINQKVASMMLQTINCEFEICDNGKQALERIVNKHYDLLLLDLGLPDLDGYEVTRQIRKSENENTHLPIVAITAFVSENELNKCFAVGMDDIVIKPVKRDHLQQTIATNLMAKV